MKRWASKPKNLDLRFSIAFPRSTAEENRLFELLRKAYVDARYNPKYKITRKELEYLGERVQKLKKLTKEVCNERIESYVWTRLTARTLRLSRAK